MAHHHLQLHEPCFNCLFERLLHSCNHSDRLWHSAIDPVCDALEIILVQYCMKCWFWAFPFLSRRDSRICCTWSFFTDWGFAFISFFFVFLRRNLLLFSFLFLFFFSFPFFFFFFWLFDLYFWEIFDNLFYIFLHHSIVTNMPIAALLCVWLQIDVMLIRYEAHYFTIRVSHLAGNAQTTTDSFTQS